MASQGNGEVEKKFDVGSILFSVSRDYLIRNNGIQIKSDGLRGKTIGLYFSASWCGPCQRFTPNLVEIYNELEPKGDFEVVFISADKDNESFDAYFSKMPWLAVPFSDNETRDRLDELFAVNGIPHLIILDDNGAVLTVDGVQVVQEHGAAGYPFTPERLAKLEEEEAEARRNQSLKSLLVSQSRDYVIAGDGSKVPVVELEGKTIGLYFVLVAHEGCQAFTSKLMNVYKALKESGEKFEVVMVPHDDDPDSFGEAFKQMPWLSLPVKDRRCEKLARYFELERLITMAVVGPDGKTLHQDVVDAIEEHGEKAYPFTPKKFAELQELEKAKREAQTLESILVLNEANFVIGKDGVKVPVSDLAGKTVLLYFSAHWCPPCRAFMPMLIQAYNEINKNGRVMEVVFISSDKEQESFDKFFSTMPWLALPFGDERKQSLNRLFKVRGIPTLVAIGPDGKTVSTKARELIMGHGANAYPFTSERMKEIEVEYEKMVEGLPERVKSTLHKDELVLSKRTIYNCDGCDEEGRIWSYYCEECDFDLHTKCALDKDGKGEDGGVAVCTMKAAEDGGWVCEMEMCTKKE